MEEKSEHWMKGKKLTSAAIKKPYEQKTITDCIIAADLGSPFGI